MTAISFDEKWATVLNADVVGYSLLAAQDSLDAARALISCFAWMTSVIDAFEGRVIDTRGDNLTAEFVLEDSAVQCALYIQRWLRDPSSARRFGMPIRFRIGVHTGRVLARATSLYGNVVNVAARLQNAAPCGGLLVSSVTTRRAASTVRTLGDCSQYSFHNIADPVEALRVML